MTSRFSSRLGPTSTGSTSSSTSNTGLTHGDGFGEWWAAIAAIALAVVGVVALSGSAEIVVPESSDDSRPISDATPRLLASLLPAERSLSAIESAFASLCQEPVLVGLELEPDCETGIINLPDELFQAAGGSALGSEAREYVAAAVTNYLARLRRLPALWDSLEGIEFRGHSDPRALRNAYETNMVGSQQKALGVLLFLVGPGGLSRSDAEDLERLAMVSGASYSRPPATCPEQTRECYPQWRRVEIRPVLSESLRRGDWARTIEDLRVTALQIQQEIEAQER